MEVGFVIENNYPLDREVRTRRVARTLSEADHSVTIFAHNSRSDRARGTIRDDLSPPSEQLEYARVERFSWLVSLPVLSLLSRPFPFNPIWIAWLLVQFRRTAPDVVVAPDIRAGPTAIVAAKLLGIPVVVDVRENYVEFAKLLSSGSGIDRIVYNLRLIAFLERFVIRAADEVWVVTEERRAAIDPRLRERSRITVVQNVPDLGEGGDPDEIGSVESYERTWSGFTFVYVGVLNDFRGLDQIIEALAHVPDDADVHVAIAGEGPHRRALERLAARLGVEDAVTFTGWIDAGAVPAFLGTGDVGLIPHEVNGFTNTTLPNKLFDCMRQGLPVLVTAMAPVERVVTEADCGVVIQAGADSERLAEVIVELRRSEQLGRMGVNAREAVERQYNWEIESDRVLETVDRLAAGS